MPRKSHADKILKELEEVSDAAGLWLVLYDFAQPPGRKITQGFYANLKRITERLGDGRRVQLSIYECEKLKTAMAIRMLAERFKARDVAIYKAEEIET